MNWIKALTDSIEYIEENLTERLAIKDIAKVAASSPYHYQRMFNMLTGISVHEYIRNRRLSMAASELVTNNSKVIDVAIKYGYESSEAFSRAFKKMHGANPTDVKKRKVNIKAFPKIVIQITLKGDLPMNYRIERKPKFSFSGIARKFSTENGENFVNIPKFWSEVMQDGSFGEMMAKVEDDKCIGACMPMNPDVDKNFDYVIGVFTKEKLSNYNYYEVPSTDWAIFEVRGPIGEKLQNTWKRIFSEWFPSTTFQHAYLPELEVYYGGDTQSPDYLTEIWIPIIKEEK
ncbi:AraC family transcriptional regulator [Clostridium sediminicola]|uniref:AraC family transcriptional regulator n=1 Tax=Clostridium sediminicola TaxID=3114879 RepID=UPI0031F252E2